MISPFSFPWGLCQGCCPERAPRGRGSWRFPHSLGARRPRPGRPGTAPQSPSAAEATAPAGKYNSLFSEKISFEIMLT